MARLVVASVLALAALLNGARARAQACEGLPFRDRGGAEATYISGDAADAPYSLRQYGGLLVRQLPGWSPLGTHQALRFEAAASRARWQPPAGTVAADAFTGWGAGGGLGYLLDALPSSAVGTYVVCASVALAGEYWRVHGLGAGGVTLPAGISFGLPLGSASLALVPHAGFGAYVRAISGRTPAGPLRPRVLRPWAVFGAGLSLRALRLDAVLRHELRDHQRLVLAAGLAL